MINMDNLHSHTNNNLSSLTPEHIKKSPSSTRLKSPCLLVHTPSQFGGDDVVSPRDDIVQPLIDGTITHQIKTHGNSKFHWNEKPKNVLIIINLYNPECFAVLQKIAEFLVTKHDCIVWVDTGLKDKLKEENINVDNINEIPDESSATCVKVDSTEGKECEQMNKLIDLLITVGGDGTLLYGVSKFLENVPPVLGINMGSMGFLTPFSKDNIFNYLEMLFDNLTVCVSLRMRLDSHIYGENEEKKEFVELHDGSCVKNLFRVFNEVVLDRGPSPFLTKLNCIVNDMPITTIQADGVIIATTTGSTAYSLSAGGSIVHPSAPSILMTPICPHSLSFRPIILPDSTQIMLQVPQSARASSWVSFDGKSRVQLQKGEGIKIYASKWPVPLICRSDETSEWFKMLNDVLKWNVRDEQKAFA